MLNNIGLPGLLLIAVVVLVLFGRGKISSLMGEVGKGITAFKRGVDDGKKELEDQAEVAKDVAPEEDKTRPDRFCSPHEGDCGCLISAGPS